MTLCISTHKYKILSFCELAEKYQRKALREFDWIEDIEKSYGYFIYKKELYNLDSFMYHNEFLKDEKSGKKFHAHGIDNSGYFNGIAIELIDRDSAVKIAYFYSYYY